MMQNSPLLVTQTSPIKNVASSTDHQSHQQPSESFEQVLSKQVKHDGAKASSAKTGSTEAKGDDLNSTADALMDIANDAEPLTTLQDATDATIDAQLLAREVLALSQGATGASVDAQLLAREVTATTLEEATDGEVVIDAKQEADILHTSFAPVIQTATQQATPNEAGLVDTKMLKQGQQPGIDIRSDAVIDEKSHGQLQANPIKDTNDLLNPKAANVFTMDAKQQSSTDVLAETNTKAISDIATVSLQASSTKPTATLASSPLQAGASNVINAFPGKAGWNSAVSQKVVWMVGAAEQSATLTLNPKDLGPLQVIINVNNEKADATFISENPEVRKALEEGMSSLRNAMGQAGVELGQANVNTSKQQQEFQQASREQTTRQGTENDTSATEGNLSGSLTNTRVSNGLVDTFA